MANASTTEPAMGGIATTVAARHGMAATTAMTATTLCDERQRGRKEKGEREEKYALHKSIIDLKSSEPLK